MATTRGLTIAAAFSALAVSSDYALSNVPNVKLVDALVFSAAFVFGLEIGVYVALISELTWGVVSPYGFGGYIIPFLVAGELIYVFAGWVASKAWAEGGGAQDGNARFGTLSLVKRFQMQNVYIGATLAICAFLWDLETNAASALLAFWPAVNLQNLIATEIVGAPFMVAHEVSDLLAGALLAPIIIFYASRNFRASLRK